LEDEGGCDIGEGQDLEYYDEHIEPVEPASPEIGELLDKQPIDKQLSHKIQYKVTLINNIEYIEQPKLLLTPINMRMREYQYNTRTSNKQSKYYLIYLMF
jgi:hypothetical protein